MNLILGGLSFIIMGITLGLVGAGGSILTLPILIYFFDIPILYATTYSLILVGSTASLAAMRYRKKIAYGQAMLFALPSFLGMIGSRRYLVPQLPSHIGSIAKDQYILLLLIVFMICSGHAMQKTSVVRYVSVKNPIVIVLLGLMTGLIMGILGAGGGFLIIPILASGLGLTMDRAVATSLFIITLNSVIGFLADPTPLTKQDWFTIFYGLFFAISGMLMGLQMAKYFNGERLKRFFGQGLWCLAGAVSMSYCAKFGMQYFY